MRSYMQAWYMYMLAWKLRSLSLNNYIYLCRGKIFFFFIYGMRGGLFVSAFVSGSSGPGLSPGRGHCVVFLGKTLYSRSAFLCPGV